MPNIFRGGGVNGILGNIGGVIADPFKMPGDEHQVQIPAQLVGVLRHSLDQTPAGARVHFVEFFITRFKTAPQFHILLHVRIDAVFEHLHRHCTHRFNQLRFR